MDIKEQAEFEQFKAFYLLINTPPHSGKTRSNLGQLRTFGVSRYGNGKMQEILREAQVANRALVKEQPERLLTGKEQGSVSRRERLPESQPPRKMHPGRFERLKSQGLLEVALAVKSGTVEAVAEAKPVKAAHVRPESEPANFELSQVLGMTAPEIVAAVGSREALLEHLAVFGETGEDLEGKTDRQLANILKKKVFE